jgi:hypothetical protein
MVANRVIAFLAVNLLLVSPVYNLGQRTDRSEHTSMTMSLAFRLTALPYWGPAIMT